MQVLLKLINFNVDHDNKATVLVRDQSDNVSFAEIRYNFTANHTVKIKSFVEMPHTQLTHCAHLASAMIDSYFDDSVQPLTTVYSLMIHILLLSKIAEIRETVFL